MIQRTERIHLIHLLEQRWM